MNRGDDDEQNDLKGKYAAKKKREIDQEKERKKTFKRQHKGDIRWNVCQISTGRHMKKKERNKTQIKKKVFFFFSQCSRLRCIHSRMMMIIIC